MEMGDGDGDGWVGAGDIVALWATVVYTQIVVRRSIDCLYDNHTSPDLRNINRRFLNFFVLVRASAGFARIDRCQAVFP